MKLDYYYYRARLMPAVLTSLPGLIVINAIVVPILGPGLTEIQAVLPWLAHLGFSSALIFLLVEINRFIAKETFQRFYFREEKHMPTTNFLLWNDSFLDEQIKASLRNKILTKFQIAIPDQHSESMNEQKSRDTIVSAVSQIRISLEGNRSLRRHNIEYGFIRNFLGGSLLAMILSFLLYMYGLQNHQTGLINAGLGLLILYAIPVLSSRLLIRRYGRYYAKILYEQFLAI